MATTISIGLQKGGTGKTTTALALSSCLGNLKKKVLLVDMDSQANSTEGSGVEPTKTIYDCFADDSTFEEAAVHCSLYDLLPGEERLAVLEKMDTEDVEIDVLKNLLAAVQSQYDFIIIDTPPALGNLLQISLVASDFVIIPCEPRPFALNRIDSFYETILASNKDIKVLGILLVKYSERTVLNKQIRLTLETKARLMHTKVFNTFIREGIAVAESQTMQVPLIEYDPKSKPCMDYQEFTQEVLKKVRAK